APPGPRPSLQRASEALESGTGWRSFESWMPSQSAAPPTSRAASRAAIVEAGATSAAPPRAITSGVKRGPSIVWLTISVAHSLRAHAGAGRLPSFPVAHGAALLAPAA